MPNALRLDPPKLRVYGRKDLDAIPEVKSLPPEQRIAMKAVSAVLPFRVNQYVVENLIDWSKVPDDPMFQLTFPQRGMLEPDDLRTMESLIRSGAPEKQVRAAAHDIQMRLNPHPAGQMELNVPSEGGEKLAGIQHKYRETVLFFPTQGQTCHAYCSYCFRWPQFAGLDDMKFASAEADLLVRYLEAHPEVTSVLFTGGDPMVMRTKVLRRYIEPLLRADLPSLASIRIGSKALAYWPHRFTTDADADDLMRLFEEVVESGRTLAFMAHSSHPVELETRAAEAAFARIMSTGAVIRCQSPIIRRVNDDADVWADLFRKEVKLGAVPYYMFIARDTGARRYFEVPLVRAYEIYRDAISQVSGLARTARGPSMSATPGKIAIDGIVEIHGERAFALRLLQARDPEWVGRPFFARLDQKASWFDDLRPAFGGQEFFFTRELDAMKRHHDIPPPSESGIRRLPLLSSEVVAA
jgi:KamA family protein